MNEVENNILQCIDEYLKEYADEYQRIVVEGGMFGDSIEFTAGYDFMKALMNYIKKQNEEIERLSKEVTMYDELLCNRNNEVDKLNNIINEVADEMLKELNENNHLSYGVALALRQKLIGYKEIGDSDTK